MIRPTLAAAALLLSACASPGSRGFAENGYPIVSQYDVTVYERLEDVPTPYEVLGSTQAYAVQRGVTSRTSVVSARELERMRREAQRDAPNRIREGARRAAGEMGANAVLVVLPGESTADPAINEALVPLRASGVPMYVALYVGTPPEADAE